LLLIQPPSVLSWLMAVLFLLSMVWLLLIQPPSVLFITFNVQPTENEGRRC
jgi:hypothetical protein